MKAKIFVGGQDTDRTRTAEIIAMYFKKENVAFLDGRKKFNFKDNPFVFDTVPDDCDLLIIDDVREDFDYNLFFNVDDSRPYGGNLRYIINRKARGKKDEMILIPNVIITTNKLPVTWTKQASFRGRFDVIDFDSWKNTWVSEQATELIKDAAKLVGHPCTNISGSTDVACMEWQERYNNWIKAQ